MEIKNQKNLKRAGRSFEKIGMRLLKFFTLFLLIFMTINVSAQIISINQSDYGIGKSCNASAFAQSGIVPAGIGTCVFDITDYNTTDCIIILPPAEIGTDYCFPMPLTAGISWGDIVNADFNVMNAFTGTEPEFNDATGFITMPGDDMCIPDDDSYLEIEIEIATASGNEETRTFWLPILREPVKFMYVLDRSGSMGWTIPGGAEIRWDILKKAVAGFSTFIEEFQQTNDAVGLTYFASDAIQPGPPINDGFITVSSGSLISNTLMNLMALQTPSGSTAMGKGLLDGRKKLQWNIPLDVTKIVLLFTDGEQNVYPEILVDGVTLENDSLLNNLCNPEDSIKYFTIGMGTGVPALDILTEIAEANKGEMLATHDANNFVIETFFEQHMQDILKASSPQTVSRRFGMLMNGQYTTKFSVNGNCSKVLFKLSHNDDDNMHLKIEKDGIDLTSDCQKKSTPYYKILSLDLPHESGEYIYSQGEWTVTVTGNSEEEFYLSCITDDHFLNYECETDKSMYTVGDSIKFSVDLSYAGNSLAGESDTVKVLIFKPGEDLGHLLATYETPESSQDSTDDISGYYEKFLSLMNNDSSFYNSLLPSEQIIILEHQGNGHYTGFFDKTELSGIYQIHFLLKGEIPGNGTFIRENLKTAVFEFGQIDNSETDYDVDVTQGDKYQTAIITIRPKNKFGYYMGPGYLSQIKIELNKKQIVIRDKADKLNGSYIRDKVDNLDGSYTFTIVNIPSGVNPKDFQIFVKGEEFIPGCAPITFRHFIILIIIILILIIVLIKKITSKKVKILIWLILILWILYMILQHFNIYCMNLF